MISSLLSELKTPLMSGLACCALNSQLRSILAFNASPTTLRTMAGLLSEMLAIITDGVVVSSANEENQEQLTILPVQLGSVETEEELWGSITLQQTDNGSSVIWQPGFLSVAQHQTIRIVIIPDLTRLSLAAIRSCVMLMGAPVAHLERHGQQGIWSPKLYWVVGCDSKRIGLVSPHLLDRFALRFHVDNSQTQTNRVAQLDTWLNSTDNRAKKNYTLSFELQTYLKEINVTSPKILPEAKQHILKYIALTDHYSPRRDLALLRLAQTLAKLNRKDRVTSYQVDDAARLLGLKPISLAEAKPDKTPVLDDDDDDQVIRDVLNRFSSAMAVPSAVQGDVALQTTKISAIEPEASPNLSVATLPPLSQDESPWVEDDTPIERDAESLRILPRHFSTATAGRGNIIGVEPATTPHDIAWVSTALEAAKFQALRQKQKLYKSVLRQSNSFESTPLTNAQLTTVPLIIQTSDLRRYRREAIPEQLLTLVIDYTCLKGCNWQDSLEPYLQWAYVERAKVCLIRVGHGHALDQLRSERYLADKVQTPRIVENLTENVGRTTPLAHGLDLALQTIRHALQHGRKAVYHAVLVVLSDGRGNVPLEASRVGHLSQAPVGKKGVEDALEIAKHLSALNKLESVVLNPQPKYYKNLPIQLAQALKGKIEVIPPTKTWELSAEDWRVEV